MNLAIVYDPQEFEKYIINFKAVCWIKMFGDVNSINETVGMVVRIQYKRDPVHLLFKFEKQPDAEDFFTWLLHTWHDPTPQEPGKIPIYTIGNIDGNANEEGQNEEGQES